MGIQAYFPLITDLTIVNDVVCLGDCLVIPSSLREMPYHPAHRTPRDKRDDSQGESIHTLARPGYAEEVRWWTPQLVSRSLVAWAVNLGPPSVQMLQLLLVAAMSAVGQISQSSSPVHQQSFQGTKCSRCEEAIL